MPLMKPQEEIEVLIRAKYPILYVTTWEEQRVVDLLQEIAQKLNRLSFSWSLTQGMKPPIPERDPGAKLPGELDALTQIHAGPECAIFHLKDFHPYMNDIRVIRVLRDLAVRLRARSQTIVITAPVLKLPVEMEKDITVIDYGLPGPEEIGGVLDSVLTAVKNTPGINS